MFSNAAKIGILILVLAAISAAAFWVSAGNDELATILPGGNSTSTSGNSTTTNTEVPNGDSGDPPSPGGDTNPPPRNDPPANQPPVNQPVSSKEISWGDRTRKQVIFTFDGGAGDHSGEEILSVLSERGINSTFFVTGKFAQTYSSLLSRLASAGHEVFNHTWSHPDLTTLSNDAIREEFRKAQAAISGVTGRTTKPYFRPPYGARDLRVREVAAQEGYRSVYWTVDALDWKPGITDEEVKARVMQNLQPGTIYMFHIGDDITGRVLDELITSIKNEGYEINSLTEGL